MYNIDNPRIISPSDTTKTQTSCFFLRFSGSTGGFGEDSVHFSLGSSIIESDFNPEGFVGGLGVVPFNSSSFIWASRFLLDS